MLGRKLGPDRPQERSQFVRARVGPGAVDRVAVILGVLRCLGSFSSSTVVGPVSCATARSAIGQARSGASTRSASSVVSHIAVVCKSSTGGPSGRGSRVAAITGSTTRSSDGNSSSIQPSSGSRSSSSNIHVSWVIARGSG